MARIQGKNNFLNQTDISTGLIVVNNNYNTSTSDAEEEDNYSHSPGSSITNIGCETPLSIRKQEVTKAYKNQHEYNEVDLYGANTNRLGIKKCQSMKTLNMDFKNQDMTDEEEFNVLEQHLSETRNRQEAKKMYKRSFSNQSLALTHPPQYELIGSKVVRGPDFKWNKQDGCPFILLYLFYFLFCVLPSRNTK